ncbi:MAG: phosphoenolpyruvate synthase [Sphingobacteriales bacterium 50-39]|nr:phosphoenolpyruvate synthase [Sphingobacteriales bacterium]OJW60823.1 MAG: phosphoenolpyruvate synthase [Sphingobacteriales bacterium 50-39]
MDAKTLILDLKSVGIGDISLVGGKNASLGEMIQNLSALGISIPGGFVITVEAYNHFVAHNKLDEKIRQLVNGIDHNNVESLRRCGLSIRQLIRNSPFPKELSNEIIEAYYKLSKLYSQEATDVAVRSSATAEDLPNASFAGQQETYLNVRGPAALMDSVRNCFASLFTDRAISYRSTFGFDHFKVGLSVCVQKMVRSDLGTSGVAFSLDTESGFSKVVVINGSYGLGEMVVQGSVSPDEFIVFKPKLNEGFPAILEKKIGIKDQMMVYGDDPDERVKVIPVDRSMQNQFCLKETQILQLAKWVCIIEEYYSKLRGHWCPMDVEWAIDGLTNHLFIVQARPETIHSRKDRDVLVEYRLNENIEQKNPIIKGIAVGNKIGSGQVNIMYSLDKRIGEHFEFKKGSVLVTDMTDPDWEPIMKQASAIVTNKGGRTCHAAIVARELGVPAIVGCGNATELLNDEMEVTVTCASGEEGMVFEGRLDFSLNETKIGNIPKVKTTILFNVASPSQAFHISNLPGKGVGLAREEFIINNYIQAHPLALLNHSTLKDEELSGKIKQLIKGFENGETFFIEKLSYGIAKIAAAFYPSPVIVRFSDFKTNEYYNLLGGKYYEPKEENPMLGWRGASRYYSTAYEKAFGMECKAIKKVREQMGLDNVIVMIPFCRTVKELYAVYAVMEKYGLKRGVNGLQVFLMAEIPSNIILADEFAKHIDGFSIGSNDLTQLVLGLDRDSSLVASIYDERNEAVKQMIIRLIDAAKKANIKVGVCGQGPSDFPDFAQFLVEQGIDSLSITPDSFLKTNEAIHKIENKWLKEPASI